MTSKTPDRSNKNDRPSGAKAPGRAAKRANEANSQLLRAKEMPGFAMGTERTDVRGWQVYSNDAVLVGSVGSLFVEMHTKAVRYLGIVLKDAPSKAPAGEVLVPVGTAMRPDDRQVVVLNSLSYAQLASAPRVPRRPITRSDENAALGVYGMATWRDVSSNDLYSGPNFEEQRLFGSPT